MILQFTGNNDHAVSRAAVEVVNLTRDYQLPLKASGTYDGFGRDDRRSWLGFHDGVNNLEPSERRQAIESRGDPEWNKGGTYIAFLRLEINLSAWRDLSKSEQELVVGRDKLTGWPLQSVRNENNELITEPVAETPIEEVTEWYLRDAYYNPPETANSLIEASHVHRVNQNKASASTPSGHRIFRQGYEYLEDIRPDGPRLGLNFISFQNDLYHLQQVLGLKGWLGDANFGGESAKGSTRHAPIRLTKLRAGGFYAVPPRDDPFPGANLFS
jgi:deferrochelatase/peroxidase EfeB